MITSRVLFGMGLLALFVSGVQEAFDEPDPGWPREIRVGEAVVALYQPQIDVLAGDSLAARAVVSVREGADAEPVFGAVWLVSRLSIDRDARTVEIDEIRVPRVRFPNVSEARQRELAALLEAELPTWDLTLDFDRFLTTLEAAESDPLPGDAVNTAPPNLIVRNSPAVLVLIDGDPVWRGVERTRLQRARNTPHTIIRDSLASRYYLHGGGDSWFTAGALTGEWQLATDVPPEVRRQAPPPSVDADPQTDVPVDDRVPEIVVSAEPAELLVIDGDPQFAPIGDGDLRAVSNTDADLFRDVATRQFYLLVAGRWYEGGRLEGPWRYVRADSLPQSFTRIPPDSPKGGVRASVAGTDEALDAVLDAQIPQTAVVKRGPADLKVTYDGEPAFERIADTNVQYAVNTASTVLRVGQAYHLCHEGVWYEALSPTGPWSTSVAVPDEVQQIPPSNPHYNVRYVRVYHYTPSAVYVGYYPGYLGWYVYGPTVVWGTGYRYRPWIGPYSYVPRPVTYGLAARYHPYYGWSFGVGARYGPVYFSWRRYSGPPGWWGPGGYRPYDPPRPTPYAGRPGASPRDVPPGRPTTPPSSNIYARPENRPRLAARPAAAEHREPGLATGRDNDVFTDRNGTVYRRTQDGWEQRAPEGWRPSPTPPSGGAPARPETRDRPPAVTPPSARPSTPARPATGLERDYLARQRGAQRADNLQRAQPAPRAAPRPGDVRRP